MVLGMSLAAYTLIHVLISLAGIASGLVVLFGMISNKPLDNWTRVFLAATVATSVTGFGFPFVKLLPSHIVGALSLFVLLLALLALYYFKLSGAWRKTYVISAVTALYFNSFVLVVQSFLKVPFLHALAPTQKEPPFVAAQAAVLTFYIVTGTLAIKKFKK
jgi:hypothetical protein